MELIDCSVTPDLLRNPYIPPHSPPANPSWMQPVLAQQEVSLQLQNQWKQASAMSVVGVRVPFLFIKLCSPCAFPWAVFFPEAASSSVWKEKVTSITLSRGTPWLLTDKLSRRWGSRTRWDCVWIQWWVIHFLGVLRIFSGEKNPTKLNNYSRATEAITSVIRNFFHTFFSGLPKHFYQKLPEVNIITILFALQIKPMWMN